MTTLRAVNAGPLADRRGWVLERDVKVRHTIRHLLVALVVAAVPALAPPAAAQTPDSAAARLRAENDSLRRVIDSLRTQLGTTRPAAAAAPEAAVLAIPARPRERHPGTVRAWFDRNVNHSYAKLESIRIDQFQVEAGYETPGERLYPPPVVHLFFYANNREPQFTRCHTVELVADGRQVRVSRNWYDLRGAAFEIIGADVPTSEFLALVTASRVEGRICTTAFVIGAPEMLALRDLASRMVPPPAPARPQ